jgi:glycosyltransferase involved in cell wall biosynthesis
LITTIHDAIIEKLPEFYSDKRHARSKRWWRWSATHADAVLTVSNTSRSDIIQTWSTPESKVHVTYPGVDEAFRPPGVEEISSTLTAFGVTRPYVLYVGHRGEHKNFQVLAEAMTIPTLSGFDLVLVGGGDPNESVVAPTEPGRKRQHHLKGVTDGQLCALYAGAVALVFPSLYEGFGFPLVEAMSCGAPVVASDIPSSREVCDDAAEFFPPRDSGGCAQSILRAAGNERRRAMIRKGLERVSLFSWASCARKTIEVYEEVLSRPQA